MVSAFDIVAMLLVLTAAFGWLNHVVFRLPHTIGLLVMGLLASLVLILIELSIPQISQHENLTNLFRRIDFQSFVLNGMLAFLLFAGALHVNLSVLRRRTWVVGVMATLGVMISTAVVGIGLWWASVLVSPGLPLVWALVFGSLISPTDPVAVISTLKSVRVPEVLEADMSGKSLFNDGVGVVVFTILVAIATGGEEASDVDPTQAAGLFVLEAVGGGVLGLVTGYIAYCATRAIDDYPIETLISLGLATGTYALAAKLHTSGPIAVVVAGIFLGNRGPRDAMSDETQRYLFSFWTLLDEILNSVLFLLIGLEVIVLRFDASFSLLAAASVPLVLFARLLAVSISVSILRVRQSFVRGTIPVLVWGGLRGGISIALALSLPEVTYKPELLAATYAVVIFSIVVQGLTLRVVAKRSIVDEG